MNSQWSVPTLVAAVGCGLMGGVFFAFSAFVMAGLNRLPADQGVRAMQSINVTAVRPPLMITLFGTAALCVALVVRAALTWGGRRSTILLVGAGLYLIGVVMMTAAYHVPLNDVLAKVDPNSAAAVAKWQDYVRNWTAWNWVRAAAGVGAAVAFTLALFVDENC
jgi:uncharacterized membrane protein